MGKYSHAKRPSTQAKPAQKKAVKKVRAAAPRKKSRFNWFAFGMIMYAVVFLAATGFGLKFLWGYMEAYEASRPNNAVNSYMDTLTAEHVCDMSQELIGSIDHNIQTEEQCRAYISEALSEGFNYAKKSKESAENKTVYVVRTGKQVIGQFAITASEPDQFGFRRWEVTEESYNLSYLIGDTVTMTAPNNYNVFVNGVRLDSSYITVTDIRYEPLEDYYDDYQLPYRVTYLAGPFLGQFDISAQDPEGNPVVIDENTDPLSFIDNCTDEEATELKGFVDTFIASYVQFAGCANRDRYGNYRELIEYVVEDTDLAERLYDAIYGLKTAQSKGDEIVSIEIKQMFRLAEGQYLCDITYDVDTTGKNGVVRQTTNAKMIVAEIDGELKAMTFSIYS